MKAYYYNMVGKVKRVMPGAGRVYRPPLDARQDPLDYWWESEECMLNIYDMHSFLLENRNRKEQRA